MKHFIQSWPEFELAIRGKTVMLCLDFDGTLSPIAQTPDQAELSRENRSLLKLLAGHCVLAIISGRAMADIKARINLPKLIYIGNHGLEIHGPQFHLENLITPPMKENLQRLKNELSRELCLINGVWVEDKGLSLSVHYRLAHPSDEPEVWKVFQRICSQDIVEDRIRVTEGKKVLEVRPDVNWDKGKAIGWLLNREHQLRENVLMIPVFFGDDATDEDAFEAISGRGIGVAVGTNGQTKAGYYLFDTMEVTDALKRMLAFFDAQANRER